MAKYLPSPAHPQLPVIIIGAGVAGLTIGQGLRNHGIPFHIYEASPISGTTQGHRFRLRKDTIDALKSILAPDLQHLLTRTCARHSGYKLRYVDARALDFPKAVPLPYPQSLPVDRTWLRNVLNLGLEESITHEKTFERFEVESDHVKVYFNDRTSAVGRFLIGADGTKSRVRRQLQPERRLLDLERNVMWGKTTLTPALKKSIPADLLTWSMVLDKDRNRQLIIEPMEWTTSVHEESNASLPDIEDYVYWALGTEPSDSRPHTAEEKRLYLLDAVRDWHPSVRLLLESAVHELSFCASIVSSSPVIEAWPNHTYKATMVGDSAHPMSPMGGGGPNTAIKDAVDLCKVIAAGLSPQNVASFEEGLRARAAQRILHSFQNGEKFWAGRQWFEYREVEAIERL